MERYIGLDVHSTSCTFAVLGEGGRKLKHEVVETNGRALVEFLKLIPGNKHLIFEEGAQSAWLYEILKHQVFEIVVTPAVRNSGPKSDKIDAFALAESLRTGAVKKRVTKEVGAFGRLCSLTRAYSQIMRDHVRAQNRLRAIFRSRAIPTADITNGDAEGWSSVIQRMPQRLRTSAGLLLEEMQTLDDLRRRSEKEMISEAKKFDAWHTLQTCPGLGPIRAAHVLATVIHPSRFRTARQFWSYCGLAVVTRSSADWSGDAQTGWQRRRPLTLGLNRNHNHVMKDVFLGAAQTVVMLTKKEPLQEDYARIVAQGTKPALARLTLARKIAATALAMWKNGENYDPAKYRKKS